MIAAPAQQVRVPARVIAFVLAAGTIAVGLVGAGFRDDEGFLTARFVLPLAVAAAFLLLAAPRVDRLGRSLFWLGLALFGQAVSLQLVYAGNAIGYQHYAPWHTLLAPQHVPAVLFLVVQTAAVVAGLRPWAGRLVSRLAALGPVRALFLGLAFVLPASALARQIDVYVTELALASLIQGVHLGAVALAALSLPAEWIDSWRARLRAWFGEATGEARPGGPDRFVLGVAVWVVAACALLAVFSYERHPHVPDEVVYLYHARYFAEGLLAMPAPPVPAAFNLDLMTMDAARWYSPVPPGWPAVLAVGAFLGAMWLVNPVLNGVNVLLAYAFLRELYDRRSARIGILLLGVSPWFVFMGMNFMTHTWTLTCALAAALATARLRRHHDAGVSPGRALVWAIVAGTGCGALGLVRPVEGLTLALLLGLWALFAAPRRWRIGPALTMTAAAALVAAITLPYNRALTGDAGVFPLIAYTDSVYGPGTNSLGFGPNRGLGWPGLDPFAGHGAIDVAVNAALNTFMVNIDLLGWGAGSLLPMAFLIVSGRMRRADRLLLISILAVIGVHSFYWFSGGPDFGARYWYLILVPCVALTVRGLDALAEFLRANADIGVASARVWFAALSFSTIALVTFFPWRAIDKYHHYRYMRPGVRRLAEAHAFGRALVLVRGERHPDYSSAGVYNPIDLDADEPVYIWDHEPGTTRRAVEAFADRAVWLLDGPTRTGEDYRVVAGPIPARRFIDGRVPRP